MKLYSYSYRDLNDSSCNYTDHDLFKGKTATKKSMVALASELKKNHEDNGQKVELVSIDKGAKIELQNENGAPIEVIELETFEVKGDD